MKQAKPSVRKQPHFSHSVPTQLAIGPMCGYTPGLIIKIYSVIQIQSIHAVDTSTMHV